MTDLEKQVAEALRLSTESGTKLQPTIQRYIQTARAELIRSGVPALVANDDTNYLVTDAVICFCQWKMTDGTYCEAYHDCFISQQENLRKSYR